MIKAAQVQQQTPSRYLRRKIHKVETVSVCKVPPFWKQHVQLWFMQIEALFQCNLITADNTRDYHLLGPLDADVMSELTDILAEPPVANKYEYLKTVIIKRFPELELGDKKPPQLLRQMKMFLGKHGSSDLLRVRWLSVLEFR